MLPTGLFVDLQQAKIPKCSEFLHFCILSDNLLAHSFEFRLLDIWPLCGRLVIWRRKLEPLRRWSGFSVPNTQRSPVWAIVHAWTWMSSPYTGISLLSASHVSSSYYEEIGCKSSANTLTFSIAASHVRKMYWVPMSFMSNFNTFISSLFSSFSTDRL
jgi:hypothetical protein